MVNQSLSIILPCYNEGQTIAKVVGQALTCAAPLVTRLEIVLVDDASTDSTQKACCELSGIHPGLRVVRHERNRGYGAALRSGFAAARHDLVFYTDADGQFRFDDLPLFLMAIGEFDLVIGYRADRQDSLPRKWNTWFGRRLARAFLGVQARDINCAYKLARRHLLQSLPLTSDGAMISAELLVFATRAGWRIHELPVAHFPRRAGRATGAKLTVLRRTILEFLRLRHRLRSMPVRSAVYCTART